MKNRRVVITGIGVVAPNGTGKEEFWAAIKEGRSGIKPITLFDASEMPVKIAGEVSGFNPEEFIGKREARRMARFSQFAVACSKMALQDSGLPGNSFEGESPGIVLGVASTDIQTVEDICRVLYFEGIKKVNPFTLSLGIPNAPVGAVAEALGINNSNITVSSGCAAGLDAVGIAYRSIRDGLVKSAFAGGTDTPVTLTMLGSLCAAGMVSREKDPLKASRPFDMLRDGGVLSEGAAVLLLEDMDRAMARGAIIYGEVAGYGQSIERKSESHGEGLKRAIIKAFNDGDAAINRLSYVSAHAPSDVNLDLIETEALKSVFGDLIYRIPVSSIKGHIGNPYSSAGVLQVVSVLMGMKEDIVPPTINYENPDPRCDLDYVPNKPRSNRIELALVNSHGLGGTSSSLLLRRVQ